MNTENLKIIPVEYAKSTISEEFVFKNGENKLYPIVFKIYLIITAEKKILVDAGCETMPGWDMKDFIGPIKALNNIGISPEEITDVIITHAHHDHIESVKYFTNANIYIQKEEYENGKVYLKNNQHIITFDSEIFVLPNVKVLKIGGHSIGSSIVEIYSDEKTYVISGDEIYSRECLLKKIPTGSSCNPEKSLEFINKYSNSKYTVLLCHNE